MKTASEPACHDRAAQADRGERPAAGPASDVDPGAGDAPPPSPSRGAAPGCRRASDAVGSAPIELERARRSPQQPGRRDGRRRRHARSLAGLERPTQRISNRSAPRAPPSIAPRLASTVASAALSRRSRDHASTASGRPRAPTSTVPSAQLRAQPRDAVGVARSRVESRKNTPCTRPWTTHRLRIDSSRPDHASRFRRVNAAFRPAAAQCSSARP